MKEALRAEEKTAVLYYLSSRSCCWQRAEGYQVSVSDTLKVTQRNASRCDEPEKFVVAE
jgi:hypothetical protein